MREWKTSAVFPPVQHTLNIEINNRIPTFFEQNHTSPGWWLNQPIWKILVKLGSSSPTYGWKFSTYLSSPGPDPNLSKLTPTHWGLLTVPLQSKPGSPGSPGYIPMTSEVKSEENCPNSLEINMIHLDFLGKLPKTQSSPPQKNDKNFPCWKGQGTLSTSRKFNPMASTLTSTSPGFKVGRLLLSGTVPPAYAAVFEGKTQCFSIAKLNFRTSILYLYNIIKSSIQWIHVNRCDYTN